MTKKDWIGLITLFIVVTLGNGVYWQWQNIKLDRIKHVHVLLERKSVLLSNILSLKEELISLNNQKISCYNSKGDIINLAKLNNINNNINNIGARLDVYKEEFVAIEKDLSKLDSTGVRKWDFDFITPSKPGIMNVK